MPDSFDDFASSRVTNGFGFMGLDQRESLKHPWVQSHEPKKIPKPAPWLSSCVTVLRDVKCTVK